MSFPEVIRGRKNGWIRLWEPTASKPGRVDAQNGLLRSTENICFVLKDCEQLLKQALAITQQDDGPDMYEKAVQSDLEKYESLSKLTSFCELYGALSDIKYDRLATAEVLRETRLN